MGNVKCKMLNVKWYLISFIIYNLTFTITSNAQIVKEFQKFRDTTYVNDKSTINTRIDSVISEIPDSANISALINDSLDIAKGKIYDSTYTRIDSIVTEVSQFASPQTIDGWYAQNIAASTNDPPDILPLARGLGSMDNEYDVSSYTLLNKLGVRINSSSVTGTIKIFAYKNGVATPASIILNPLTTNYIESVLLDSVSFLPGDYFDLRYSYENDSYYTPDIKAFAELLYPIRKDINTDQSTQFLVTRTPIDSGLISVYKINNGVVTDSNMTYVAEDDSLLFVSRAQGGYRHWVWRGVEANGLSRTNDSLYLVATSDISIKARYRLSTAKNNDTIRVIINQPDGNTDIGVKMKKAFMYGFDDAGEWLNWNTYWDDSIEVVYYADLEDAYKYADSVCADLVLEGMYNSRVTATAGNNLAQKYYPIQTFVPAGGTDSTDMDSTYQYWDSDYPNEQFPAAWVFGTVPYEQSTYDNETSYDVEFRGHSPSSNNEWGQEINSGNPQARYAIAWSAGLMYKSIKYNGQSNYTLPDNEIDYYSFRSLLHNTFGSGYVTPATWSNQNGFGDAWDIGNIQDVALVIRYAILTLSNRYYFRDLDPYLRK